MSVLELQQADALRDDRLLVAYDDFASGARSATAGREIFAFKVYSDSGNAYETEIFVSDLRTACGYCSCPARVVCRHIKAALYVTRQRDPTFGTAIGWTEAVTLKACAEAALEVLTGEVIEHCLVDRSRPNYTICDMLREGLGLPPQDRSDW